MQIITDQIVQSTAWRKTPILQDTILAIKRLVNGFVELDGIAPAVRCTVSPTMMTHMGTTHASLVLEERSVCTAGMALIAKSTVCLGMTLWQVSLAIHKGRKFVCGIGSVHNNAMSIVSQPMIQLQVTLVTLLGTSCAYKAGMVHHVIANQEMITPWAIHVILLREKENAWWDGLEEIAMFFVFQETTPEVILPVTVSLEQKNVYQSGLGRTAPYSARPEMIPWANTSAQ